MSWLTGPWDDRVMNGTDQGGAGEAAAGSVQRRLPAATGWRCLLPRPTLRLLSFLLFRRGLDNALQAPLQHGRPRLPRPIATLPPPHSPAGSAAKGLSSAFPTRAQLEVRDQAIHQLLVQSGIALPVMALASVGLGWWVAGR